MRHLVIAALLFTVSPANAFPDRPITMVIPTAPGTAVDGYARALGDHFTRVLGQPVVITNRDGASGVIGMRSVAQSAPDGHTLAIAPMVSLAVQPHMVANTGLGPDAVEPVCGTNENIFGIVVRADSPIQHLPGLVIEGRRRQLAFGSPGPNSLPQIAVWRVMRASSVEFVHAPYRGDAPNLNDLMGGRLDFSAVTVSSAAELIDSGRLRLLAVFSARRHPDYPAVPTAREQGIDAEQLSQVGIYAPRGTPLAVLERLEAACRSGVDDAQFRRITAAARVTVNFMPRAAIAALLNAEYANFGRVLPELGVRPN